MCIRVPLGVLLFRVQGWLSIEGLGFGLGFWGLGSLIFQSPRKSDTLNTAFCVILMRLWYLRGRGGLLGALKVQGLGWSRSAGAEESPVRWGHNLKPRSPSGVKA